MEKVKTTAKRKTAKKVPEKVKPKFRYFLSDGREIESIEGLVVPVTPRTLPAYNILAQLTLEKMK